MTLRFLTAGESHGPALSAIIEGFPSGLALEAADIDVELQRRQSGYGRGDRMKIERDQVRITAGVIEGVTTGAPLALWIENRDWANWKDRQVAPWHVPRPGHADLAGSTKYALPDMRWIAERASARETTTRVAVGAACKKLLRELGVAIGSYVTELGAVRADIPAEPPSVLWASAEASDVRCPDESAAEAMRRHVDEARAQGDSLGGVFVVAATGLPVGLGSHVHWDRRLDGRIAQAIVSIPAIKGVEIGPAFENARLPGTQVHDALYPAPGSGGGEPDCGIVRHSNRAGGLEGGITNGEPLVVRAAMKPIPTTISPLESVNTVTGEATTTQYQRSDVCALPAACVVAEAMLAWVLADAFIEKFGGDSMGELLRSVSE